ncbi:MAG: hypothetical protein RXR41_03325 [Candidatus Marsarchaeota archaeon]
MSLTLRPRHERNITIKADAGTQLEINADTLLGNTGQMEGVR